MRLSEFEQITEYSTFSKGIRKKLESQGYRFLGQGVDQMAFREPGTGWVLKVFGTQKSTTGKSATFSPDHKMFFIWAKYCMERPKNPFLPKFAGFESFIWEGGTYLQIRQEHLTPAGTVGRFVADLGYSMEDFVGDGATDRTIKRAIARNEWVGQFRKELLAFLSDDEYDLLLDTLLDLLRISLRNKFSWDLHAGNIMQRGQTPVLVDPWVI